MADLKNIKAISEMLIRKPVSEVYNSFIDPEITSKFWFSRGSGKLEQGKTVKWHWDMYNFHLNAKAITLKENKRIVVEWNADGEEPTTIEWNFNDRNDNTTYVSITNYGFKGDDESIVNEAIGSTEGFTFVLAGAKAYLEHDIQLNLVADKFPDGLKM